MQRALVIDDDPGMRAWLRAALEEDGFAVDEASDGRKGVRRYRDLPADVVFCDIFMGEQEGLTTIRLLRAEFPGVRIVAMSGGSAIGDYLSDARLMGAAATLAKPFGMVALRSVLTQLGHNTPAVTAS